MIVVLIYNNITNKFERYCLELYDPMPYTRKNKLTVKSFLSGSFSSIAWTTTEFLEVLLRVLNSHNDNMRISRCFRRIYEGGHIAESQHYAGVAADFAYDIKPVSRLKMYHDLKYGNRFSYIDNIRHTQNHIHADSRLQGSKYGYPPLSLGDYGIYVLVLQDALNTLGITGSALDGFFGRLTLDSVKSFQTANKLSATGNVDRSTWQRLASAAAGSGANPTVLHITCRPPTKR